MRLIDTDALLEKAWDAENGFGWEKVVSIKDVIDAPTIDAVEVVRCKDCRWWERDYQPRYHPDEHPCNILGMGTLPDWFCADNERRDDD